MFSHPSKVCMSYLSHMKFSFYLAYKFFIASIVAIIHGIYPDVFITHSSDLIKELSEEMKKIGCR